MMAVEGTEIVIHKKRTADRVQIFELMMVSGGKLKAQLPSPDLKAMTPIMSSGEKNAHTFS